MSANIQAEATMERIVLENLDYLNSFSMGQTSIQDRQAQKVVALMPRIPDIHTSSCG